MVVLIALSFLSACSTVTPKNKIESQGNDYKIVIRDKDSALSEARAWEEAKDFCEKQNKRAVITRTDSKAIGAVTKEPPTVAQVIQIRKNTKTKDEDVSSALVTIAQKDHEAVLYFQCFNNE